MLELHPLIRPNANSHYQTGKGGDNTIIDLEEDMTVNECIGACRWNMYKYSKREKGQNEEDLMKIIDYGRYKDSLINLKANGFGEMRVDEAWKLSNKEWRYQ